MKKLIKKLMIITLLVFLLKGLTIVSNNDYENYKASYSYYLQANKLEDTQANYLLYLQLKEI